jgi:hypothetical protein
MNESLSTRQKAKKWLVLIVVIVIIAAASYCTGKLTSDHAKIVYEVPSDHVYHKTWQLDWQPLPGKVIKAAIVSEKPDELYVYLNTVYKGHYGPAGICGVVSGNESNEYWVCDAMPVNPGKSFSVIRFRLRPESPEKICSNAFSVYMQDGNGNNFYSEEFAYKKLWLKRPDNIATRLQQTFIRCPDKSDKPTAIDSKNKNEQTDE